MKAQRLLAILTILLNRKKVSASYLAKHFEVSLRTVYRDVDALAEAGIPVFATSGRNGGFELVEGFTMNSQLLETKEVQQILAGLQGLSGIYPGSAVSTIMEKFSLILKDSGHKGVACPQNHIFIELTPSLREKTIIGRIEESINLRSVLKIAYGDGNGTETVRETEPHALVFVWQSWYVYAWCRLRSDFRMFKVSRIQGAETLDGARLSPAIDLEERPWSKNWESKPFEELVFTADKVALSRLGEFFDSDCIAAREDGRLLVTAFFPVDEWVISFIMGLPGAVTILKPDSMRNAIRERARELCEKNGK